MTKQLLELKLSDSKFSTPFTTPFGHAEVVALNLS